MEFDPARLRRGELVVGASSLVLLASLFLMPWYGHGSATLTGWHSLSHARWLALVTIAVGLALVFFQGARRAPALPATLSIVGTVLAVATVIALIYRVINVPGPDGLLGRKVGVWVGLASAVALLYGAFTSLRQEGIAPQDERRDIPTVSLDQDS